MSVFKSNESQIQPRTDGAGESVVDPRLRIDMLGPLRLTRSDGPIAGRFGSQKAGALLAFLALTCRPQPRERLIDIFWPDMEIEAGRDNLSWTLGAIRKHLEPPGVRSGAVLVASRAEVGLNPVAVSTDVEEFEGLLQRAGKADDPATRLSLLQSAAVLYRGDFLPQFYYDWSIREQQRLQGLAVDALTQISDYARENAQDLPTALDAAQKLLALDAFSEEAIERVIAIEVALGNARQARKTLASVEKRFASEFGSGLSNASKKRIAAIFADGVQTRAPAKSGSIQAPPSVDVDLPPLPARGSASLLPLPLSRFFGREEEKETLLGLLGLASDRSTAALCRLVTVIGPGGMGKTRLVTEVAHAAADDASLLVYFVPAVEVDSADQVAALIARRMRIDVSSGSTPLDCVLTHLSDRERIGERRSLLVLDNLEHLVEGEHSGPARRGDRTTSVQAIVQAILTKTKTVSVLCTSRLRMGIPGEKLLSITPLPLPDFVDPAASAPLSVEALATIARMPSVRLYVDRAQCVRPEFALTNLNAASVGAICRVLEGSPLGIELAASWVRLLPPRKMWERLSERIALPEAGAHDDIPLRHRSLSAALEWSYNLLSPAAQETFRQMAVFHGGWSIEAAEAVTGSAQTVGLLAALQDASLASSVATDDGEPRYYYLETVRTFARDLLTVSAELTEVAARHADYFLALAERAEPNMRGPAQEHWLGILEQENPNLRASLDWLSAQTTDEAAGMLRRMTVALTRFWRVRGYWREAASRVDLALSGADDELPNLMRAKLLRTRGVFCQVLGELGDALSMYTQAHRIRVSLGDRDGIGESLHSIGFVCLRLRRFEEARSCYLQSLDIARDAGNTIGIADELHHLGLAAHEQGDLQAAQRYYEESLEIRRPLQDNRGTAMTLTALANAVSFIQSGSAARPYYEESLKLSRAMGDRATIADSLFSLAIAGIAERECIDEAAMIREALQLYYELNDTSGTVQTLELAAACRIDARDNSLGVRLHSAGLRLGGDKEKRWFDQFAKYISIRLENARQGLGKERYAAEVEAGVKMEYEQAVRAALNALVSPGR